MYTVLLYYKYVPISNPEVFREEQRTLCQELNLMGRIIVAEEGINGTVEGKTENVEEYISQMKNDPRFSDVHWKKSNGTGASFPKLSVKVRSEIVSSYLGEKDIDPTKTTGKYLTPEELHEWIWGEHNCLLGFHDTNPHSNSLPEGERVQRKLRNQREFYIVDMRNDFETKSGYFENSIFPGFSNFRDLKEILPKLSHLKNKTILTVCTGGVRCEKASGFLVTSGFSDVYQLKGGIVSYMERYPNLDFKGKLYVFDKRLVMGFNTESRDHKIVGKCENCHTPSEYYINCKDDLCHRHFIACEKCLDKDGKLLCPQGCIQVESSQATHS